MSASTDNPMLKKLRRTIEKHAMVRPHDIVLVAVSGGPDSVCLLSALHQLSLEYHFKISVAHLDHQFRGAESADDARFVAELAARFCVPATIESVDAPRYCREHGLSNQQGAREVRYRFLEQLADKLGASRIATGHTADDQAETLLMRLIRGAGPAGLASIPPVRDAIIRPLLCVTRAEVMRYLSDQNLPFRTDSSNLKPCYTRNRIRQEVMPVLRGFNPRIVETLAAEAAMLREEDHAITAWLLGIVEMRTCEDSDAVSIKRDVFETLPVAFQRRLLRLLLGQVGEEVSVLSRGQLEGALAFMCTAPTGARHRVTHRIELAREYNRFLLYVPTTPISFRRELLLPGTTAIPEAGVMVETAFADPCDDGQNRGNYRWQAAFDYDKIAAPIFARARRPADRFCPAGMRGRHKKLQDFFVDARVPRRKRDAIPLLCAGDDILWVVGLRTDERFIATPMSKNVLHVRVVHDSDDGENAW